MAWSADMPPCTPLSLYSMHKVRYMFPQSNEQRYPLTGDQQTDPAQKEKNYCMKEARFGGRCKYILLDIKNTGGKHIPPVSGQKPTGLWHQKKIHHQSVNKFSSKKRCKSFYNNDLRPHLSILFFPYCPISIVPLHWALSERKGAVDFSSDL